MFAYKKLKSSDAGILAFEAHKEYNINETNQSSFGVSLTNTQYSSASRDTYSSSSNDPFNHKRYFQLDHLFTATKELVPSRRIFAGLRRSIETHGATLYFSPKETNTNCLV